MKYNTSHMDSHPDISATIPTNISSNAQEIKQMTFNEAHRSACDELILHQELQTHSFDLDHRRRSLNIKRCL